MYLLYLQYGKLCYHQTFFFLYNYSEYLLNMSYMGVYENMHFRFVVFVGLRKIFLFLRYSSVTETGEKGGDSYSMWCSSLILISPKWYIIEECEKLYIGIHT